MATLEDVGHDVRYAGRVLLLVVSVAAALGPARRTSRVDPAVTLRAE